MPRVKEILEIAVLLFAFASGIVTGIKFIKSQRDKKFPLQKKDDGFYYDKKGKKPYCPYCYDNSRFRARVVNDKCTRCNKVYKIPPVVIIVNKRRGLDPRFRIR